MDYLLEKIWKAMGSFLRWHVLWLMNDKFFVGVSGVVLNQDNQILLLRHRFWKDCSWGLPSGHAKGGERLEETLVREVKEETGYDIQTDALLRLGSGYRLRVDVTFLAHLIGDELKLDPREVLEAKFFSPDALPNTLLDSHRELIKQALEK